MFGDKRIKAINRAAPATQAKSLLRSCGQGEIATTLTIITLLVLTVGVFVGTQLSQENTDIRSRAQSSCPLNGNPQLISGGKCQISTDPSTTLVCALIDPNLTGDQLVAGQDPESGPNAINWDINNGTGTVQLYKEPSVTFSSSKTYRIVVYDWNNAAGCTKTTDIGGSSIIASFGGGNGTNPTATNTPAQSQPTNTPTPPEQVTNTPIPNTPTNTPTATATKTLSAQCSDLTGFCVQDKSNCQEYNRFDSLNRDLWAIQSTPLGCTNPQPLCCAPTNQTPTPTPTQYIPSPGNTPVSFTTSCGIKVEYVDNYVKTTLNNKVYFVPYNQAGKTQETVNYDCPGVKFSDL